MPLTLLKNCSVTVRMEKTQNRVAIPIANRIDNIKFNESSKDYVFEVQIPPMIKDISLNFTCEVLNNTSHTKDILTVNKSLPMERHSSEEKGVIYLRKYIKNNVTNYMAELLGNNGEGKGELPVKVKFNHRNYIESFEVELESDLSSRVDLGELKDIFLIHISFNSMNYKTFIVNNETNYTYPTLLDILENDKVVLPLYTTDDKVNVSL